MLNVDSQMNCRKRPQSKTPPKSKGVMVAGEGFEPSKAEPGDLQSPPIGRSGNPPGPYFISGKSTTVLVQNEISGSW